MIREGGKVVFVAACLAIGLLSGSCDTNEPDQPGRFSVVEYGPVAVSKSNSIEIWAHMMPWFESKETTGTGKWGMHWTMNTKNPDRMDNAGKREIASHFYPLTGPYASGDPDMIEYQLLLMKYCGIDGVLIDWYGSTDWNDYKGNRTNSEAIINALDKIGLKFAIVYEDRTVPEVLQNDASLDRIGVAQADMQYIEQNYFSNPRYMKVDGKPLLLVFGPEEFTLPSDWTEIFSSLTTQPCFLTLNGASGKAGNTASGEYIWVDNSSLDNKYGNMSRFNVYVGGAYPGFYDFYKEGGWGDGFSWSIAMNNGETFRQNLEIAKKAGVKYVQLITWNDYGEGTMIEPTQEMGFTLLQVVQDFTGVSYSNIELEKIYDLYNLRKSNAANSENQKHLDQSFYYWVSLQTDKAVQIIDSLKTNE
ncbi:MAG TPA: glycoside hydrolase family 71/99-like protein [Prolixibacteraceae bacterium]|nr:glycoside hydrolase family 71/99-like protein [Prolixibacteraceae bacterium]HPS12082.1 glycoside hydrolase family 71/99-like protein [Prolixibacteraceae bacterium]